MSRMLHRFTILLSLLAMPVAHALEPVTSLTKLRGLSVEEAARGVPVLIEGTVVGLEPSAPFHFFLHDGETGCFIKTILSGRPAIPPVPGDRVRVEGVSDALGYYPSVKDAWVRVLGKNPLPPPVKPNQGDIFSPQLDSQWVEVRAVVTGYEVGNARITLTVEVYGRPFKAELPMSPNAEEMASSLIPRPVRLRGIMGTIFNRQRQMTDRHFFVPSFDDIIPEESVENEGDSPLLPVSRLLTESYGPTSLVRLRGTVTQRANEGFYLRDSSGSTLIQAPTPSDFPPGTVVEVEGFGAVAPFRPRLRSIRVTKIDGPSAIAPVPFDFTKEDRAMLHSERVTLVANYLGRSEGRSEAILQFSMDGRFFEAFLPDHGNDDPIPLTSGDRVRLTGICELTTSHALPRIEWVDGFRIQLPGYRGIEILSRAPWWTTRRLLVALGIMSGIAALGFFGTWLLRRQVKSQMLIISEKLCAEAVVGERDRMARELHDTLEQQLSGVALQLDSLDHTIDQNPTAASAALSLARRMLRYTRLEARRSVWDLRSKVLEQDGLSAALRAIAETTGPTGPTIDVIVRGGERPLPAGVDFHLLRIAQEATTNAIKHGDAALIRIDLEYLPDLTRLTITDNGNGFDPTATQTLPGPHFGLLGMRERAAKIGARLTLVSSASEGCVVTVCLPNQAH